MDLPVGWTIDNGEHANRGASRARTVGIWADSNCKIPQKQIRAIILICLFIGHKLKFDHCSNDSLWAHSRVQKQLKKSKLSTLFLLSNACY